MRKKPAVAAQPKEAVDLYAVFSRWARSIFQFALGGFVIALSYLLYAIFSGVLNRPVDAATATRYVHNLTLMGRVLTACGVVGTLCVLFLTLGEVAWAVLLGLIGAGLMFGLPMLVAASLRQGDPRYLEAVNEAGRTTGLAIIFLVGLRILYEIVVQIRTAEQRRQEREAREGVEALKKVKKPPRPGLWSPCWKLPYCHEAVREACPAYKARRSCWRFGYGCNCDPGLIERLIRSGALEAARGASKASSRDKAVHAAYVRSDLAADQPLRPRERTIPCSKCPIYLDHQRQKFRLVNPLAVAATIVALVLAYKPLRLIYHQVVQAIADVASRVTFDPQRVDPGQWVRYLDTPALQVFFFVIVGLLALAYVLKFVEWAIFEKKW